MNVKELCYVMRTSYKIYECPNKFLTWNGISLCPPGPKELEWSTKNAQLSRHKKNGPSDKDCARSMYSALDRPAFTLRNTNMTQFWSSLCLILTRIFPNMEERLASTHTCQDLPRMWCVRQALGLFRGCVRFCRLPEVVWQTTHMPTMPTVLNLNDNEMTLQTWSCYQPASPALETSWWYITADKEQMFLIAMGFF